MRRGYVREASALFLGAFWMLVTGVVLFSGGIRVTMSAFFVTVTVVTGLLLGARIGLSVAGLNMVVTLGLVYLESVDRVPPRFFNAPPPVAWVELAVNLALTGVALALTLRSLNTALSRTHESEQAAAAQAAEMREVNARLEHEIAEREASEAEREHLLEEQTVLQQQVIDAQQQALRELSTPVIPVMDDILVMPLIGSIDSTRAQEILRAVLHGISEHSARVVILDVTGVPLMDTGIVNHLNKTIQAARLKGARVIVTGISDAVAESIVDLGIDWSVVETLRDLQTGLTVALDQLGFKVTW
jgi:rsbT co-antagonist protein RsbR